MLLYVTHHVTECKEYFSFSVSVVEMNLVLSIFILRFFTTAVKCLPQGEFLVNSGGIVDGTVDSINDNPVDYTDIHLEGTENSQANGIGNCLRSRRFV